MKLFFLIPILFSIAAAQDSATVQMLVTVEGQHNAAPPQVSQSDVVIHEGKTRLEPTAWTAVPELELVVLVDDNESTDLGLQFRDLKSFFALLPPTVKIGVEYMRNGTSQVAQALTSDHAAAAKSLRLPLGPASAGSSPYMSLQELVKHWPVSGARREVLMISSGIDPYYPVGPENPYLEAAIAEAQKGGVVVHSIYYGAGGHLGHSYARSNWGQNFLSMLGDQTGGEPYWQGFINPVSFQSYLKDLSVRLSHQYLLTFRAPSGKKGEWHSIKLSTEVSGAELISANRAFVPGDR